MESVGVRCSIWSVIFMERQIESQIRVENGQSLGDAHISLLFIELFSVSFLLSTFLVFPQNSILLLYIRRVP